MVDLLFADENHVVEGIEKLTDRSFTDDDGCLTVYNGDPVMRGITLEEKQDRDLTGHCGESICEFRYDGTELTINIHESVVEGEFVLNPAGPRGIGAEQATKIRSLAPKLTKVLDSMEEEYDIVCYDFSEVSAGSIAHGGHFTDFEFEYSVTSTSF